MKELKFDGLNEWLQMITPSDYDCTFITISCDVSNACAQVIREAIKAGAIPKKQANEKHLNLLRAVVDTLTDMCERFERERLNNDV